MSAKQNDHINLFHSFGYLRNSLREKVTGKKTLTESDLFTLSLALSVSVKRMFWQKAQLKLSREPIFHKKLITQFGRRMRIDGLEKFNGSTIFSVVHFFADRKDMEKNKPAGLLTTFIEENFIADFMELINYPPIDEDEDDEVLDACGAVCNLIAGYFKKEIARIGYKDLEMSPFSSYINTSVNGEVYPLSEAEKYEISYEIGGVKRLVTEMVMGPLSRTEE